MFSKDFCLGSVHLVLLIHVHEKPRYVDDVVHRPPGGFYCFPDVLIGDTGLFSHVFGNRFELLRDMGWEW